MKKIVKKFCAHYKTIKSCWIYAIIIFLLIVVISLCVGLLLNEINFYLALKFCAKWSLILVSVALVIILIVAFCFSDYLQFTERSIIYHKNIFAKKFFSIDYDKITECVVSEGSWKFEGKYVWGFKIFLCGENFPTQIYEASVSIIMCLLERLGESKVKFVRREVEINNTNLNIKEKFDLKTLSEYYNINCSNLTTEELKTLCKHFCKITKRNTNDGNEILKKNKNI